MVIAGLMLALLLAALDQNIVATALPRIVSDLGGLSHLSWVVTGFALASTASTPLYGKLSDLHGRKPAFLVSISVFLAGSALCGLARSMTALIAFRAVQGLGAGGLFTLAQTTVGDLVSPRERGRYQGLFAGMFAIGSVAGPLLGGFITDAFSWPWIFYVNLPVGGAALAMIGFGLRRRPPPAARRIDAGGSLLLIAATTCVLLATSWGGVLYAWTSPVILGLALAACAAGLALAVLEHHVPDPVLPPRLFHDRVFLLSVAVMSLTAMALFGALVFLPLFFQLMLGTSASMAGIRMTPVMGGVIVASVLGGRLVSKTGRYKPPPVLGLLVATLCFLALARTTMTGATPGAGGGWIEPVLALLGLGIGLVMPNLTTAIQNGVPRADLGAATSAAVFFRSLGGAFGAAVSGAILNTRLTALLPTGLRQAQGHSILDSGLTALATLPPTEHALLLSAYARALSATFLVGAAVAGLALLCALCIPERPLRGADG